MIEIRMEHSIGPFLSVPLNRQKIYSAGSKGFVRKLPIKMY